MAEYDSRATREREAMKHLICLTVFACLATASNAETITVCLDGSCDYTDVQSAVAASEDGDVIEVAAGVYQLTSPINPQGRAVEVRGELGSNGDLLAILDGQQITGIVRCTTYETPSTVFRDLVFRNGQSYEGGGVYLDYAYPTIFNCTLEYCSATKGGALYFNDRWGTKGEAIAIEDSRFIGNVAVDGGAICLEGNSATVISINGCLITDNQASNRGGGIYDDFCDGSGLTGLNLSNCYISLNESSTGGGLYKATWCTDDVQAIDVVFCGNTPNQMYLDGPGFPIDANCLAYSCSDANENGLPDKCDASGVSIRHVPGEYPTIQDAINAASNGDEIHIAAGIYASASGLPLIQTDGKALSFVGTQGPNVTVLDGESVLQIARLTSGESQGTQFIGLTFLNGHGEQGGAVFSPEGVPYFENCDFVSNFAETQGGALFVEDGSGYFKDCVFIGNDAAVAGGAIYHYSSSQLTLEGCFVSGNSSPQGAGISSAWAFGRINLYDSVVCGNVPDQIYGAWDTDAQSCVAASCTDTDENGLPDKCNNRGGSTHLVPDEYEAIQDAINAASDGDEILVSPGSYIGVGPWVCNPLGKQIVVRSVGGPDVTFIDGEQQRTGIVAAGGETGDTAFIGFTIRNGHAERGGGAYCNFTSISFVNCHFQGNHAIDDGGGIYSRYWDGLLDNCRFKSNTAGDGGGGLHVYRKSPDVTATEFVENTAASGVGGGVLFSNVLYGSVWLECVFESNQARYGGAIFASSTFEYLGIASFQGCDFALNSALDNGSAGYSNYTGWSGFEFIQCTFDTCCSMVPVLPGEYTNANVFGGRPYMACDPCRSDVDCSGVVDAGDLGQLLAAWGASQAQYDLNMDGTVDAGDLGLILAYWGTCE